MQTSIVAASQVVPPHEVRDSNLYNTLHASMESVGWQGRPILVIDRGDHYQGITGSHRVAVAKSLALDVPIAICEEGTIWEDRDWSIDLALRDLDGFCRDLRDYDADAADLLAQDL